MIPRERKRLGELLLAKGYVDGEELEAALGEQREKGGRLGDILISRGNASEQPVLEALAVQSGLAVTMLDEGEMDPAARKKMPARLAQHYGVFPVSLGESGLKLAVEAPPEPDQLQEMTAVLGIGIEIVLAPAKRIEEAIQRYYGVGAAIVERMVSSEDGERGGARGTEEWEDDRVETADDSAGEGSVRELVNQLLSDAWLKRATDIHLEPFPGELSVRYRIDGVLCEAKVSANIRRFYRGMISRIKIMANLDISEQRRPQDGRLKVRIRNQEVDMRLSLLPSAFGEAAVIRILSSAKLLRLDSVGLSERHRQSVRRLIEKPHGMILLTGPTGSGKTTTLYSCLNEINREERKIITVEDPVEYLLKGIIQMQVHPKIGLTFAAGLKHMLRHDPDVMMVGEIRDGETAEIAVRSALTGHLVFSTLHTNDAPSAVARLLDLGVPPYLVSSSLMAVIAQRLVRVICEHCREESPLEKYSGEEFEKLLNTHYANKPFYHGAGCEQCRGTGYQGRTAVHEVMLVDDTLKEMISNRASMSVLRRQALAAGMEDLHRDGLDKAARGITTVQEIFRVTR